MNFTTKQRKFIGISKEKIKLSVKSHLVCVIKNTQNNTKCMKLHTECKSCLTMDRCKNDIFCKYVLHTLCRPHTFVYIQKSPHDVQITHSVQDYTLMCCITYTVWYYTEYVKLLHSTVPIVLRPIWKNLHRAKKLTRPSSLTNIRYGKMILKIC